MVTKLACIKNTKKFATNETECYMLSGGSKFATSSLTKGLKMHHVKEHSEFTKAKEKTI